jgi:hypothetical protein
LSSTSTSFAKRSQPPPFSRSTLRAHRSLHPCIRLNQRQTPPLHTPAKLPKFRSSLEPVRPPQPPPPCVEGMSIDAYHPSLGAASPRTLFSRATPSGSTPTRTRKIPSFGVLRLLSSRSPPSPWSSPWLSASLAFSFQTVYYVLMFHHDRRSHRAFIRQIFRLGHHLLFSLHSHQVRDA